MGKVYIVRLIIALALSAFMISCGEESTSETVYQMIDEEPLHTANFVLDFDQDGLAHYPFGPDMDDDNDGLLTRFAGGRDVNDQDPSIGIVGKGNGEFSTAERYGGSVDLLNHTYFADFNSDGWLDPMMLNGEMSSIGVYLNKGNRDFNTAVNQGVSTEFDGKYPAIGDFDGDGNLDMALISEYMGSKIAWGHGDGYFTHTTFVEGISTGLILRNMVTADFNEDGFLDLAATDTTNGRITVIFNNGSGEFPLENVIHLSVTVSQQDKEEENSIQGLAFGNLNNDSTFDLITLKNGAVSVFLNNGDGTFEEEMETELPVGFEEYGGNNIALGDFNEDGNLDLITDSDTESTLLVALGDRKGSFFHQELIALETRYFNPEAIYSVSDIDGDGLLDVVTTEDSRSQIGILRGNGDGTFLVGIIDVGYGLSVDGAAVADFNGDGIFDIAVNVDGSGSDDNYGQGLHVFWGR